MNKKQDTPLIEIEDIGDKDYLTRPTDQLLEDFGAGNHIPGSGSAAILSSLLGIEMLRTVIKLTLDKDEYQAVHEAFKLNLDTLENTYKPRLMELFNSDVKEFHLVSYHRRKRDQAEGNEDDEKFNYHKKEALEQLRKATEIPMEVYRISNTLMRIAFTTFDNGFRATRGDSGVAISNLLSALSGSFYVLFLNLKSFKRGNWKNEKQIESIELLGRFRELQRQAYSRVINLYNKSSIESGTQQLLLFEETPPNRR